jgi:hypothetical protein
MIRLCFHIEIIVCEFKEDKSQFFVKIENDVNDKIYDTPMSIINIWNRSQSAQEFSTVIIIEVIEKFRCLCKD